MVLADSDRISPVPSYSGIPLGQSSYVYRAFTFCGAAFQTASSSTSGPAPLDGAMRALQPRQGLDLTGLGSSPFARHYLGNHYCFLFLRVLRCFSSPGWLYRAYGFSTE
jgi:hypothetical protein